MRIYDNPVCTTCRLKAMSTRPLIMTRIGRRPKRKQCLAKSIANNTKIPRKIKSHFRFLGILSGFYFRFLQIKLTSTCEKVIESIFNSVLSWKFCKAHTY